jgi:hypothetical protein
MKRLASTRKFPAVMFALLATTAALPTPTFARVRDPSQGHDSQRPLVNRVPADSSIGSIYKAPFYGNG